MTSNSVVHITDFSLRPGEYQPMHRSGGSSISGAERMVFGSYTFNHVSTRNGQMVLDFEFLPLSSQFFARSLQLAAAAHEYRVKNSIPSGADGLGSVGDTRRLNDDK